METEQTFSLADYDWVGVDLDHTFVRYNIHTSDDMIYKAYCSGLVQLHNYPSELILVAFLSLFLFFFLFVSSSPLFSFFDLAAFNHHILTIRHLSSTGRL